MPLCKQQTSILCVLSLLMPLCEQNSPGMFIDLLPAIIHF